ncbi:hypothetical protein C2845_PM07G01760 [Panicum miliaceum]|uniref:Uncharacterized protein n=1 Tax=Panicum miliaceum TaxID=4540 RepID=A0A3L6SQX9_PANMI|nr:hypothetical protein C2845_PM07G01760 [Panicum miliaceum]
MKTKLIVVIHVEWAQKGAYLSFVTPKCDNTFLRHMDDIPIYYYFSNFRIRSNCRRLLHKSIVCDLVSAPMLEFSCTCQDVHGS